MIYAQYICILCLVCLCSALPPQFLRTKDELSPTDKASSILMLKEASRLCQTTDICGSNSSETDEALQRQLDRSSCCLHCACDDGCGIRGDCCFPTADDMHLDNVRSNYQECVFPTTKRIIATEKYKHNAYYMTTRCPAGKVVPSFDSREDCGNIRVAPWGSLYPVYSSSTGNIYKNHACADCHGVHDGVPWMAFMDCKQTGVIPSGTRKITVADNFDWLNKYSVSQYCHLRFRFQKDLKTEKCFQGVIDTCNGTEMDIPEWSEMNSAHIINACHSGFGAPFEYFQAYSNVFCFLCNGGPVVGAETCFNTDVDEYSAPGSFTFLLEGDIFKAETRLETSLESRSPDACRIPDIQNQGEACVPLYCPSGLIYNRKYQCVHPASFWQIPYYHVALRLELVSAKLKTSTLMAEIQDEGEITTWLLSPWPQWWTTNSLYYETGSGANASWVKCLIVVLRTRPVKRHKAVLSEIRRQMKKFWTLNITSSSTTLSAEFLEYTIVKTYHNRRLITGPRWYVIGLKKQQTYGVDVSWENSMWAIVDKELLEHEGRINQMNYCKQISLRQNVSDYELLADDYLLLYNGRFYFDEEFELVVREDGTFEPRVCLSDSLYNETPAEKSSATQMKVVIVSTMLLLQVFVHHSGTA